VREYFLVAGTACISDMQDINIVNSYEGKSDRIWCVIPVYNNGATVKDIAIECKQYLDNVIVVDDGSTDTDVGKLLEGTGVTVLSHDRNRGKGEAVLTALKYVKDHGGTHIITLDGDGQHFAGDIQKFLPLIKHHDTSVIIGCRNFDTVNVPDGSRFGRQFSNMWIRIETGLALNDTQSGFRVYPVKYLSQLHLHGRHYDFEVEVLTRAAWAGIEVKEVDISVSYPDRESRISNFHPFLDNLRISPMHARLVGRRLLPWPHRKLVRTGKPHHDMSSIKHPVALIKRLLYENTSPAGLATSAAVGTILAVLPLIGIHTLVIIYVTVRLHLNKVMAVAIQNLYIPPFVPFLCVEVGYYMRYGKWWYDFSWDSIVVNLHHRLFEWFLGSLVLAPIYAVISAMAVFSIATVLQKRRLRKALPANPV